MQSSSNEDKPHELFELLEVNGLMSFLLLFLCEINVSFSFFIKKVEVFWMRFYIYSSPT